MASQIIRGDPRLTRWGTLFVHNIVHALCVLFQRCVHATKCFSSEFQNTPELNTFKNYKNKVPHTTAFFYKSQREVSQPCRPIETQNPGGNAVRTLNRLRRLDVGYIAITAAGLSGGASIAHASEVRSAATCLLVKV